ncbi:hypothetical protein [Salipiger bermudensis]|uniref:hypothetical protein n=1 Tax=Salipiger bermudensis TaxID=344736 RepID=UPI0030097F6A
MKRRWPLQEFRRKAFLALLAVYALLLLLICLQASGMLSRETISVGAVSRSVTIKHVGETSTWDFEDIVLCVRKPFDRSAARRSGPCDERRFIHGFPETGEETADAPYDPKERHSVTLGMHDGVVTTLTWEADRGIWLDLDGHRSFETGARIALSKEQWQRIGTLTFTGRATIGAAAASGEDGILLSGNYEVRERSIFSRRTDSIKTGAFRRGDSVSLVGPDGSARVYGAVFPDDGGASSTAFHVTLASSEASAVKVSYFGAADPALIRANLLDRATESPYILALAFALSVLFGTAELLWPRCFPTSGRRDASLVDDAEAP